MKIMGKNRMIIIKCIEKIGWIMTKISPCCEARYKPSLIKWRSSSTCSHGLDPAATCRADFRVFSTMEGSYIRYLSTVNRKSCQGLKIKPNHCKFCHMSFFAGGFKHLGWQYKLFKAALERRWEIVSLQHLLRNTLNLDSILSSTISISKLCETDSPNLIPYNHTIYIKAHHTIHKYKPV